MQAQQHEHQTPRAVREFDSMPDSALVSIKVAEQIVERSRASFYRDVKAGKLTIIKVGCSTRLRVGELRAMIGVKEAGQ